METPLIAIYTPVLATGWEFPAGLAIVICVVLAGWVIFAFNRLVREKNLLAEGWSGIDVQLRRRRNLIPNLVEIVKGYSDYEKSVLERITELRTRGEQAKGMRETETAENALTDQIKGLFALAERYPDIKAGANFLDLQEQLAEIEDQLQMARRYYNGAVRNYNIRVERFPGNIVAGIFGYRRAEFFQIETATERKAPEVDIN
ncbi:MAG: LemA family protein [Planctomycetota bacterium]|nr:LemA family protein [Planctomycetota bacterium]